MYYIDTNCNNSFLIKVKEHLNIVTLKQKYYYLQLINKENIHLKQRGYSP